MGFRVIVRAITPQKLLGLRSYYFRRYLREPLGGPFNGQQGRKRMFEDLARTTTFKAVIETGTYTGSTTEYLAKQTGLPTYSVESDPRFFYYAYWRFKGSKQISLTLGDSRQFLESLAKDKHIPKSDVFFYLDAHFFEDLPLFGEIELITKHWTRSVLMLDDFEVPGDAGYGVDDYGSGKRLCLDYLPQSASQYKIFFPSIASSEETGLKRGSIILADKEHAALLSTLPTLRAMAQ